MTPFSCRSGKGTSSSRTWPRSSSGAATLRDLEKSNNFKQDEVRELASKFPDILVIEKRVTGGRPSEIVRITQK
jgi:hypothetical protein